MQKTAKVLPESYYEIKNWENEGKIYEKIGIKQFRKALTDVAKRVDKENNSKKFENNYFIWSSKIEDLETLITLQKENEAWHLFVEIIGRSYTIYELLEYNSVSIVHNIIITIINTYPLFLQRYNRARILKVIEKKKEHEAMQIKKGISKP